MCQLLKQEVVLFLTLLKYFTACPRTMYNSTCLVNCFTGAYSFDKAKKIHVKTINTPSNIITLFAILLICSVSWAVISIC